MVLIFAHRGYQVNGDPENSIPAFQTAVHYGAGGIELDIHLTSDRKLICYHDDSLVKIGKSSLIREMSFNELKYLELAEGVFIPSLEEVCEIFGNKIALNIEVKMQLRIPGPTPDIGGRARGYPCRGQQKLDGKVFRIGHLGWVTEADITEVIERLRVVLPQVGHRVTGTAL